jgi:hypothetical protein
LQALQPLFPSVRLGTVAREAFCVFNDEDGDAIRAGRSGKADGTVQRFMTFRTATVPLEML